jgi:uncharacterized protein YjdB
MKRLAAIIAAGAVAACTPGLYRRDVAAVVSGPTAVQVGATVQLTVRLEYSDGSVRLLAPSMMASVAWSSSNTAVATVNFQGAVTGVAAGTATITATPATTSTGTGDRTAGNHTITVQ